MASGKHLLYTSKNLYRHEILKCIYRDIFENTEKISLSFIRLYYKMFAPNYHNTDFVNYGAIATNEYAKSVLAFKIFTFMTGDRHEQVGMDRRATLYIKEFGLWNVGNSQYVYSNADHRLGCANNVTFVTQDTQQNNFKCTMDPLKNHINQ